MNHDEQTLAATLRGNPDLLRVNLPEIGYLVDVDPSVETAGQASERRNSRPRSNRHAEAITLIVDLAHVCGWRVAFFRPARTAKGWRTPVGGDGAGWPDLVLARTHADQVSGTMVIGVPDLLFFEVKIPPDRVRPEQQAWLDLLGGRVVNPFNEADWQFIQGALE